MNKIAFLASALRFGSFLILWTLIRESIKKIRESIKSLFNPKPKRVAA